MGDPVCSVMPGRVQGKHKGNACTFREGKVLHRGSDDIQRGQVRVIRIIPEFY